MPAPDLPPINAADVPRPLYVHLHAKLVAPEAMAGGVVVVIDNLRASVTMTAALAHGATCVIPTLTVEDAVSIRDATVRERSSRGASGTLPHGRGSDSAPLLGGERGGVLIPGFDLDNSPRAYKRERVGGRTVVFTTANGTAALLQARLAAEIYVGSFVNLSIVCDRVKNDPRPVHLLCCGTREEIGLDDILPGGAMAERLLAAGRGFASDDSGRVALAVWKGVGHSREALIEAMSHARGGRGLASLGLSGDVEMCSAIDSLPVLPQFDPTTGFVTLA